jgi:hypothetical protein
MVLSILVFDISNDEDSTALEPSHDQIAAAASNDHEPNCMHSRGFSSVR